MLDAAIDGAGEQRARHRGVVQIIAERIADRVGHDDLRGEMDDRIDAVLGEKLGHEVLVAEIADDQRHVVRHGGTEAGRQVVEHDHLLAGCDEFENGVAADITGAARDEDGHLPPACCLPDPNGHGLNLCQPPPGRLLASSKPR